MLTFIVLIGLPPLVVIFAAFWIARIFKGGLPYSSTSLLVAFSGLVLPVLWLGSTASYPAYGNALYSLDLFLLLVGAAVVGGVGLLLRGPRARRLAGSLLIVAYPLVLYGLLAAMSLLAYHRNIYVVKITTGA